MSEVEVKCDYVKCWLLAQGQSEPTREKYVHIDLEQGKVIATGDVGSDQYRKRQEEESANFILAEALKIEFFSIIRQRKQFGTNFL